MTEDAFLTAICDNPEDDAPRLHYAEWLVQHGQSLRGDFIRIQCQLAKDPQRIELQERERELRREFEREWGGPLRGWVNGWEFHRGMVEAVTARPEAFLQHAADIFRTAPVRRVHFLTAMLQLARPHIICPSAAAIMPMLASCPYLARLSALSFWASVVGDIGVEALAASEHLGKLTSLNLVGNDVGDKGVQALAASPAFSRLTSLNLGSNRIGPAGSEALANSPYLTQLTSLDLGENPLGDAGIVFLAESANVRNLTTLCLNRCGLGSVGARVLATTPSLSRLKSLDVRDNTIGNKARLALRLRFGKGNCRF